jgi:hypothetical protein
MQAVLHGVVLSIRIIRQGVAVPGQLTYIARRQRQATL